MIPDVYDALLLVSVGLFGAASLFVGWSILRDRRAGSGQRRTRGTVALELVAWAVPTILMIGLFVAAIRSDR